MGAEDRPELLVATLVDQVLVHLAEGGQVAVGVVVGLRGAAVVLDLEPVVGDVLLRQHADPDALVLVASWHDGRAALDGDGLRQRSQRAHRHAVVVRVRARGCRAGCRECPATRRSSSSTRRLA